MGLTISLAPNERLYVNGAQIMNPGRKTIRLTIDNESIVMRESAFLKPEEVKTGLQYLRFISQCLYLKAGDAESQRQEFVKALKIALDEAPTVADKQNLVKVAMLAEEQQWGRCLSQLWQITRDLEAKTAAGEDSGREDPTA